jgi:hypothetical protein
MITLFAGKTASQQPTGHNRLQEVHRGTLQRRKARPGAAPFTLRDLNANRLWLACSLLALNITACMCIQRYVRAARPVALSSLAPTVYNR